MIDWTHFDLPLWREAIERECDCEHGLHKYSVFKEGVAYCAHCGKTLEYEEGRRVMSDELKERVKAIWSFSTNQDLNPFRNTPEYKAGVEDAIARIEFLWYCYKHGPADQDTWDTMDTIAEVQAIVELLLEE